MDEDGALPIQPCTEYPTPTVLHEDVRSPFDGLDLHMFVPDLHMCVPDNRSTDLLRERISTTDKPAGRSVAKDSY